MWSKEEEAILIEECKNNTMYKDIAKKLNKSYGSITQKAFRMGIKNNRIQAKEKWTHERYVEELKLKNSSLIPIETYKGSKVRILHKCLICNNEYKSSPKDRLDLRNHGCKFCNRGGNSYGIGVPKNSPAITYLVYISEYDLYKIGVTSKTIKERMNDNKLSESKYEVILERYFKYGSDAMQLEKEWLSSIEEYKINTGLLKTGNTETFKLPL